MAVLGHEDRDFMVSAARVLATDRVDHHGRRPAVAVDQVEFHFGDRALHLQQRKPMRLMENLPANGQEILQSQLSHELFALITQPCAERVIRAAYESIGVGQDQAARRYLVPDASPGEAVVFSVHRAGQALPGIPSWHRYWRAVR